MDLCDEVYVENFVRGVEISFSPPKSYYVYVGLGFLLRARKNRVLASSPDGLGSFLIAAQASKPVEWNGAKYWDSIIVDFPRTSGKSLPQKYTRTVKLTRRSKNKSSAEVYLARVLLDDKNRIRAFIKITPSLYKIEKDSRENLAAVFINKDLCPKFRKPGEIIPAEYVL
jgi:hypothetical protein